MYIRFLRYDIMHPMRIHDTRVIIDCHQTDIEKRFGDWKVNIDSLLYIRLYHLPPYFDVPVSVKSKLAPYLKPDTEHRLFEGSPKETLMALELGCVVCGRVPDLVNNIWTMKLEDGWRGGVCPDCMVPPYCGMCGAPATKPWNMCDACWLEFHQRPIKSLAVRYGSCSALLLYQPHEVVKAVPTTRCYRNMKSVEELFPLGKQCVRITQLNQLDINVKEVCEKYVKHNSDQARKG